MASTILDIPESIDGYRLACMKDTLNAKARATHIYSPSHVKTTSGPYSTKIIFMNSTADSGMPHTRPPNYICLPTYISEGKRFKEIMQHELIHIHQRRNDTAWRNTFYKQGWIPVEEKHIPEHWLRRCRLNPDTMDQRFYAWENRWVPLPLFEREDKPTLHECVVRWWDQCSGHLDSSAPRSFEETFGKNHPQAEHPREVSAVNLSKQFSVDSWDSLHEYIDTIYLNHI